MLMSELKKGGADAKVAETIGNIDLKTFDLDGDGQIDWQEFVAGAMDDHAVYNEDNLATVNPIPTPRSHTTRTHTHTHAHTWPRLASPR